MANKSSIALFFAATSALTISTSAFRGENYMGVLKLLLGLGVLLGVNSSGFALAALGLVFLILSLNNYRKKRNA